MYLPDFGEFERLAAQGNLVPVYREILADLETPVSAFAKLDEGSRHAFLLESVEGGEKWARYSFLGADSGLVYRIRGRQVEIDRDGAVERFEGETDPFARLRTLLARARPVPLPGMPRFAGGAVGYIGYECVRFFERFPEPADSPAAAGVPPPEDAAFLFTDTLVVFDNLRHRLRIVSNAPVPPGAGRAELKAAYETACERIDRVIARLRRPVLPRPLAGSGRGAPIRVVPRVPRERYLEMVARAKAYIRAGDVFQVVPSQRFDVECEAAPFDVYRGLRVVNPSPYMFFLRLGSRTLIGSSPEVMVRLADRTVELRPIAGTRPRGADPEADAALERDLLASEKERAEHVMLVDLGRNDVGRVALPGTVEVDQFMTVERYSHVMHLVSNVRGTLAPGLDAFDVLKATFPAGTVTGAPKVRAMEIIHELEGEPRGPYAGAVGYIAFSGNMDLCITIRTLVYEGGRYWVQAGGGVVADSDPAAEYQETVNKAMALLKAAELAQGGLD
ncbi:MAG TPA: anthranilate synthase component I [Thermodesulfobacteriota bacterium]|nr:anthranilate synthase component I [Thermodesulfobacteriota bacterium]